MNETVLPEANTAVLVVVVVVAVMVIVAIVVLVELDTVLCNINLDVQV
jgi:hypothetical protein